MTRRACRIGAPIVLAALIAACGGPQKPATTTQAPAAQSAPVAEPEAAPKAEKPAKQAASPAKPRPRHDPTKQHPPLPDLSAGKLIGMAPDALVEQLGEPRLIRREAPAEVWQYTRPGCVLLVFLYETETDPMSVWYLEMHDGSVSLASLSTVAQKTCLQKLFLDSHQAKLTKES